MSDIFNLPHTRNPDEANSYISRTENNELPLIKRSFIKKAYAGLQSLIWDSLIEETPNDKWKAYLRLLRRVSRKKATLTYKEVQKAIKEKDSDKLWQFLGYCTHKGLFENTNRGEILESSIYGFPLIFRETNNLTI